MNRYANIALSVASLSASYGSLFLVYSVLLARSSPVAQFLGIAIATLSLATQVGDLGYGVTVARHVAQSSRVPGLRRLAADRLKHLLPVIVVPLILGAAFWQGSGAFLVFLSSIPSVLASTGNSQGYIDGCNLTWVSLCTAAIPNLALAGMAYFLSDAAGFRPQVALGAAHAVGTAVAVLIQYAVYRRLRGRITFSDSAAHATEARWQLMTQMPGQLYWRGIVALVGLKMGPAAATVYIYARQIQNALSQVNYVVRRAEFPTLCRNLSAGQDALVRTLRSQPVSLAASLGSAAGMLCVGTVLDVIGISIPAAARTTLQFFALVPLASGLVGLLSQGLIGLGHPRTVLIVITGSIPVSLAFAATASPETSLLRISIGETLMHLAQGLAICGVLARLKDRKCS